MVGADVKDAQAQMRHSRANQRAEMDMANSLKIWWPGTELNRFVAFRISK
jgi:hypothetical protein